MRVMTYNILDGGEGRLPLIINAILKASPDYLTINEANTFAANDNTLLHEVSQKIGLPYCAIALSGEYDYHVAAFSKYPLKNVRKVQPLKRACIIAEVSTELGDISIASLHLNPYSEDLRYEEIKSVIEKQKSFDKRMLMGDTNSLSASDEYDEKIIDTFNEAQRKKYVEDGAFRFDAIEAILSSDYRDAAVVLGKNKISTVPTKSNAHPAHYEFRIDDIFLSEPLASHLVSYEVIKNETTDQASDHYPIVIELK